MPCRFEESRSKLTGSELSEIEKKEFLDHLPSCRDCQEYMLALESLREAAREVPPSYLTFDISRNVLAKLSPEKRERMAEETVKDSLGFLKRIFRFPERVMAPALTAALITAVIFITYLQNNNPDHHTLALRPVFKTLELLYGTAIVKDSSGKEQNLKQGLYQNMSASLILERGSRAIISPDGLSKIIMDDGSLNLKDRIIFFEDGAAFFQIDPLSSFRQVRTRNLLIQVRGTVFSVEVNSGTRPVIACFEGSVLVTHIPSQVSIELEKGECMRDDSGIEPLLKKIPSPSHAILDRVDEFRKNGLLAADSFSFRQALENETVSSGKHRHPCGDVRSSFTTLENTPVDSLSEPSGKYSSKSSTYQFTSSSEKQPTSSPAEEIKENNSAGLRENLVGEELKLENCSFETSLDRPIH